MCSKRTHALILDWLNAGCWTVCASTIRTGLRDPLEYFQRLRARAPEAWIVGEKILEPGEFLPPKLADRRYQRPTTSSTWPRVCWCSHRAWLS